jgi:glycosyltransferase involved in cell wall biosynthesis
LRLERIAAERELLASVDIVITTSPALTQHCSEIRDDVVELTNVGDFDLFHQAADVGPLPNDVADISRPILMFYGALSSYKVDLHLLELLAKRRDDWSFVLIGPRGRPGDSDRLFDRLTSLPNVHWMGARSQVDLPCYLRAADVLLLPYVLTQHTRHVFPLKFFEYLATGKPVVATQLEALSGYSHVISIAMDADDYERLIVAALERGAEGSSTRIDLARQHTWESRVQSIRDLVLEREGISIGVMDGHHRW